MNSPFAYTPTSARQNAPPPRRTRQTAASGPPFRLLALAYCGILVELFLFLLGTVLAHWTGYACGALYVPVTVFAFRYKDRIRKRSDSYSAPGFIKHLPSSALALGLGMAVLHAYYLATHRSLA